MFRKYYFNKTKAEWAFKTEVIAWLESRKKTNGEKITHHEALAIFAVGAPIEAKKGGAPSKERKKRQKKSAKTASNN